MRVCPSRRSHNPTLGSGGGFSGDLGAEDKQVGRLDLVDLISCCCWFHAAGSALPCRLFGAHLANNDPSGSLEGELSFSALAISLPFLFQRDAAPHHKVEFEGTPSSTMPTLAWSRKRQSHTQDLARLDDPPMPPTPSTLAVSSNIACLRDATQLPGRDALADGRCGKKGS